jgi:hypothetical protein
VFEGNIKNPNIDIWYLISQVLKNAFIQALYPSLENSVNINSVGKIPEGFIKNKTEPKKTKKQIRQEKRAKNKAEKEKQKKEKNKA